MSGPEFKPGTILVPIDFSASSMRAVSLARELAEALGAARILLVHAYYVPPELAMYAPHRVPGYLEALEEAARKELDRANEKLGPGGPSAECLARRGMPEQVIPEIARERGSDLIVMGTHGRTGLSRWALGSVAERVLRTAPCPVLTARAEGES